MIKVTELTYKCENGDKHNCPNMKERQDGSMEAETYDCEKCGERYKLYYEDMA